MQALRAKSIKLTGYLEFLLRSEAMGSGDGKVVVITPDAASERGCQLSLLLENDAKQLFARLKAAEVKCDFREPNVIRAAPTPLYNTFHEVWRFARIVASS